MSAFRSDDNDRRLPSLLTDKILTIVEPNFHLRASTRHTKISVKGVRRNQVSSGRRPVSLLWSLCRLRYRKSYFLDLADRYHDSGSWGKFGRTSHLRKVLSTICFMSLSSYPVSVPVWNYFSRSSIVPHICQIVSLC